MQKAYYFLVVFVIAWMASQAQPADDSLRTKRVVIGAGTGLVVFSATTWFLYDSWYKGYESSRFHTFNDMLEWRGIDKAGHALSAYSESLLAFHAIRWMGVNRNKSAWYAAGAGFVTQTSIEIMDGFSQKWGFSWSDFAFNQLGTSIFLGQELLWQEQRLLLKVSNSLPRYSLQPIFSDDREFYTTAADRARELFGNSTPEKLLKDYNGTTVWLSANLSSIFPQHISGDKSFFNALNVAVGYGAGNMYGGFENKWISSSGSTFIMDQGTYKRYTQFYLSLDLDLSRIPTNSKFLRTVFGCLNWVKIPLPTLEVNTLGKTKFHPVFW